MSNVSNVTGRKAPVTHKDLSIAYMLNGLDAVAPLLANHTDPVKVLDRTIAELENGGRDVEELQELRAVFAARNDSNGQRGRKPAKVGETRSFSVQQITNDGVAGDVFIRLPLSTLGVKKGEKVYAAFADGKITLSAKAFKQ